VPKTSFNMVACLTTILLAMPLQLHTQERINEVKLETQAINIVKRFASELKPKLKTAIQSGGFVHAIETCSVEAPRISQSISKDTGWSVKRVSLRSRNRQSAKPDDYEKRILLSFNQRQISGEDTSNMTHSGFSNGSYRFMKAQAVERLCLGCHGESVAESVNAAILEKYPEDSATGYSLGQIRGAFSLVKER